MLEIKAFEFHIIVAESGVKPRPLYNSKETWSQYYATSENETLTQRWGNIWLCSGRCPVWDVCCKWGCWWHNACQFLLAGPRGLDTDCQVVYGVSKTVIQFNSVKRNDVSRNRFEWYSLKPCYINPPPPCIVVLDLSVKTLDVKALDFHRIAPESFIYLSST